MHDSKNSVAESFPPSLATLELSMKLNVSRFGADERKSFFRQHNRGTPCHKRQRRPTKTALKEEFIGEMLEGTLHVVSNKYGFSNKGGRTRLPNAEAGRGDSALLGSPAYYNHIWKCEVCLILTIPLSPALLH